jgi:hypothetical protein
MSARPHSENGFIAFLLGVVTMAIVALGVGAFMMDDGRDAPIRTAELSIPVPELPPLPAVPPRSEVPTAP